MKALALCFGTQTEKKPSRIRERSASLPAFVPSLLSLAANNSEADAWELKVQVACSRGKESEAGAVCKELASSSCCCVDNHFHNVSDEASRAVHSDVSVLLHALHITA